MEKTLFSHIDFKVLCDSKALQGNCKWFKFTPFRMYSRHEVFLSNLELDFTIKMYLWQRLWKFILYWIHFIWLCTNLMNDVTAIEQRLQAKRVEHCVTPVWSCMGIYTYTLILNFMLLLSDKFLSKSMKSSGERNHFNISNKYLHWTLTKSWNFPE